MKGQYPTPASWNGWQPDPEPPTPGEEEQEPRFNSDWERNQWLLKKKQAEYIANQPAPVPQSAKDRAFLEAEKVYRQIMAEEAAKTANQREAETLNTEVGSLSTRIEQLIQTGAEMSQLRPLEQELSAKTARLNELTGSEG